VLQESKFDNTGFSGQPRVENILLKRFPYGTEIGSRPKGTAVLSADETNTAALDTGKIFIPGQLKNN
jgi:hypothetical protein